MHRYIPVYSILNFCLFLLSAPASAQTVRVNNDTNLKQVSFRNEKISGIIDYNKKVNISSLTVNGQQVIAGDSGIYSLIETKGHAYSTLQLDMSPSVTVKSNTIAIRNIAYGDEMSRIKEDWTITLTNKEILLKIDRDCSDNLLIQKQGSPVITFNNVNTWNGAYQDYGGLAWFYLFNKRQDNYGVHSPSAKFWNSKTGNGLQVAATADDNRLAADYKRNEHDELVYQIAVSKNEFVPRFDSGTQRRRFIRDTSAWVWATFTRPAGRTTHEISFSWFDFEKKYGRGKLAGINQQQVSDVLNTIARIGVIDKQHFGGNSWHTPYGPICLHEQYIAQMGLAINDPAYLTGYQDCLDFYCSQAIKPDGRVWPRWAYTNEDAMPGEVNEAGFYEAQWGYLLDSNPDLVTNVAELYDQTGDLDWIRKHQLACERALDWIINRDSNGNGLVEMMTDNFTQKRGSDWIDIIWASYENAFVNAKLYHALVLWSAIEKRLGNADKAAFYSTFAQKLKTNFNKSTSDGGFWDEENKCYIHWRDKDGSLHGRNMVTPVNFMAIGYNICDDEERKKTILDAIETQMQRENLFFWPLCMYTYAPGEGNDWQFPFPNYENGDLFLSWGAMGVKAYASYKPELAIKYVKNVLSQYAKDGLAYQRYGRKEQQGLGDDILAGNSLAVVGLYQSIYGINPLYNRFYLNPKITNELAGTQLRYKFRGDLLTIDLAPGEYAISNGRFRIASPKHFGFYSHNDTLLYFNGNTEDASASIISPAKRNVSIKIKQWDEAGYAWSQSAVAGPVRYTLNKLAANKNYTLTIDGKVLKQVHAGDNGHLSFDCALTQKSVLIELKMNQE